jgi:hypothetical protein
VPVFHKKPSTGFLGELLRGAVEGALVPRGSIEVRDPRL